jgi:hypothetical protein
MQTAVPHPSASAPSLTSTATSYCHPSAGEDEQEEHHIDLPPQRKKKKKRVNKSLSSHGCGQKAKAIKSEATRNVFPPLKEESTSLQQVPLTHGSIPLALQLKSICNKKDYERRKTQRAKQEVKHLKDELLSARANIADLEHINKCVVY